MSTAKGQRLNTGIVTQGGAHCSGHSIAAQAEGRRPFGNAVALSGDSPLLTGLLALSFPHAVFSARPGCAAGPCLSSVSVSTLTGPSPSNNQARAISCAGLVVRPREAEVTCRVAQSGEETGEEVNKPPYLALN